MRELLTGMFRQETHPRRREKYQEQLWEPTGLPWELGVNPGNSHPSAPQGGQEQPGFPGINQDQDSSKAVPTFQGRRSLRSSFPQHLLQTLEVSQGAAMSWGAKIPQICSQRLQEPQETPPGAALGFGQTPQGHQPQHGLFQRDGATGGCTKPFLFSSSKPRIHPGIQQWPQRHFHGARDESGITKNAKKHKSMDPPWTTEEREFLTFTLGRNLPLSLEFPRNGVPCVAQLQLHTWLRSCSYTKHPEGPLGRTRDPWEGTRDTKKGGDRSLCCPTGPNPSSSSAHGHSQSVPEHPRSSTGGVSSAQRCETRQELILGAQVPSFPEDAPHLP